MKKLTLWLFFFTLPGVIFAPRLRPPTPPQKLQAVRKGGTWYFAESGHAVYCHGPVMYIADKPGTITRVATFCEGEKTMVPLKD